MSIGKIKWRNIKDIKIYIKNNVSKYNNVAMNMLNFLKFITKITIQTNEITLI